MFHEFLPSGGMVNPDELETQPMDFNLLTLPEWCDGRIKTLEAWLGEP